MFYSSSIVIFAHVTDFFVCLFFRGGYNVQTKPAAMVTGFPKKKKKEVNTGLYKSEAAF